MTAVHHYWLRRRTTTSEPPNTGAVFAWPCFPTKYFVQGTGSVLNTGVPNSINGWLSAWPWSGAGDASPCEFVMFRNASEQPAQSTNLGPVPRGQAWCIESRVGWSGSDSTYLKVYPLRWSSGFYVEYIPDTRALSLYVGSTVVYSTLLLPGLNSDVLHHWAATYSNGTIKLWINGALVTTYSGTVPSAASAGVVIRYDGGAVVGGRLYVAGVRYWDVEHYTAQFIPPTQLTL